MTHGRSSLGVMLPYLSAGVVISFQAGVFGVVRCRCTREWGKRCICCWNAAGPLGLFLHIVLPFLSSALVHPCLRCPSMFSIQPKLCATVWTLRFSAEVQLFVSVPAVLQRQRSAEQSLLSCTGFFLWTPPPPTQSVSSYPRESTTLALLT